MTDKPFSTILDYILFLCFLNRITEPRGWMPLLPHPSPPCLPQNSGFWIASGDWSQQSAGKREVSNGGIHPLGSGAQCSGSSCADEPLHYPQRQVVWPERNFVVWIQATGPNELGISGLEDWAQDFRVRTSQHATLTVPMTCCCFGPFIPFSNSVSSIYKAETEILTYLPPLLLAGCQD